MILDTTIRAIKDSEAEEAARIARRDYLRDLLAETDAVMASLERRNLRDLDATSSALGRRLLALYRTVLGEELTPAHKAVQETQAALEKLYETQDVILDWLHPRRAALRRAEAAAEREKASAEEAAG
jgi:hypothetical protein